MSILIVASVVVGFLINLFYFWRRLKEDYVAKAIFSSGFLILFGVILGLIASYYFAPTAWFWTALFGSFLAFLLSIRKFKLSFFESLEAYGIGLLSWITIVIGVVAISTENYISLWVFFMLLIIIALYTVLDKRYKSFSWYKSGKVGFAGAATLALFFLSRSVIALAGFNVISLMDGLYEAILSIVLAILMFLIIFKLGKIAK